MKTLQNHTEGNFFDLKKESKPKCQKDGVFAHIQNVSKWGEWGWNETLDDGVDRKTIQR